MIAAIIVIDILTILIFLGLGIKAYSKINEKLEKLDDKVHTTYDRSYHLFNWTNNINNKTSQILDTQKKIEELSEKITIEARVRAKNIKKEIQNDRFSNLDDE